MKAKSLLMGSVVTRCSFEPLANRIVVVNGVGSAATLSQFPLSTGENGTLRARRLETTARPMRLILSKDLQVWRSFSHQIRGAESFDDNSIIPLWQNFQSFWIRG